MKLTEKQQEILSYILSFREINGVSPTYKEMADDFDCYPNAIDGHIKALIKKGALTDPRGRARMLVPT